MHPAYSVIFFTTASGAGYGLLGLTGALAALGLALPTRLFGGLALLLALLLITAGLLSSTAHLGHPERAWRALTQWRTSWLSREGVLALATYVPGGLFALAWLFGGSAERWRLLGALCLVMALLTVAATGMIYQSLKTIQRWHNRWVTPIYLAHALATGALLANALALATGPAPGWLPWFAAAVTVAAWNVKRAYWRFIDHSASAATPGSATGFGDARVALFEAPHTQSSYPLDEMGYTVARRHAERLRRIAMAGGHFAAALAALSAFGPGWLAALIAVVAALVGLGATLVERWLFFAEARHTVMLYYGAEQA